jgi:hypothetical protein
LKIVVLVVEDSPITALISGPDILDWVTVILVMKWEQRVIWLIIPDVTFSWLDFVPPEGGVKRLPYGEKAINLTACDVSGSYYDVGVADLRMVKPEDRVKGSDRYITHVAYTSLVV